MSTLQRDLLDQDPKERAAYNAGRYHLNKEKAEFVRSLAEKKLTQRALARECAKAWGGDWGSNQCNGQDIHEAAAWYLGEDFYP